jgi:hypothetical protein
MVLSAAMAYVTPVKISLAVNATVARCLQQRLTAVTALTRTVTTLLTVMMKIVKTLRLVFVQRKENGAVITKSAARTIAVERNANNLSKIEHLCEL